MLYKFSRIDKRQPESYSDTLVLGQAIHRVLADFYLKLQSGPGWRKRTWRKALANIGNPWLMAAVTFTTRQAKATTPTVTEGKELLAAFNRDLPDEDCKILGVEQVFTCELEGLPVPLIGIYDLVLEDPAGIITIVDHKTASKSYTMADANQNLQMTIYHMAARTNGYGEQDLLLRLDVLIKTKVPKFEQYYTARGDWEERTNH